MGHASGPLAFPPHEKCSWSNRFDDPSRSYRTLYCAEQRATCLRETLAPFRPSVVALREFEAVIGGAPARVGIVPVVWRRSNVLAPAALEIVSGELVDIDDLGVRRLLEGRHAELLREHGFEHLDISELRGRRRAVTQALGRSLHDDGAAGVIFRSNIDDQRCMALFEGRARLAPAGDPEPLSDPLPDLLAVCRELGLSLAGLA